MHIAVKKILEKTKNKKQKIRGLFCLLFLFVLTACTSKEDVILELEKQEQIQETGGLADEKENVSAEAGTSIGNAASIETSVSMENAALEGSDNIQQREGLADEQARVSPTAEIYVHICGAVVKPGVYALPTGSRVYEGIAAAGGFREDACEDYVNQAKPLQDGQRLVIPTVEEAEAARENSSYQEIWMSEAVDAEETEETEEPSVGTDGLVNINMASESELCGINGIGASRAAAIVAYRQEHGSFASIEDIMKVSGIKEGTYEKIKDKITVK